MHIYRQLIYVIHYRQSCVNVCTLGKTQTYMEVVDKCNGANMDLEITRDVVKDLIAQKDIS